MRYGAPTPRRRDALRNRSAIVDAASELMLSRAGVLTPEIARRAGVGPATVYRHFPDRHALVAAVVADQLARLDAVVLQGAHPFRELLAMGLHLYAVLHPLPAAADGLDRRLALVLAPAVRAARDAGRVRPDLTPEDLALLCTMLAAAPGPPERSIALLLDGVCR